MTARLTVLLPFLAMAGYLIGAGETQALVYFCLCYGLFVAAYLVGLREGRGRAS